MTVEYTINFPLDGNELQCATVKREKKKTDRIDIIEILLRKFYDCSRKWLCDFYACHKTVFNVYLYHIRVLLENL